MYRGDQRTAHHAVGRAATAHRLVERGVDSPRVIDLASNLGEHAFGKPARLAALRAVLQPQQFSRNLLKGIRDFENCVECHRDPRVEPEKGGGRESGRRKRD